MFVLITMSLLLARSTKSLTSITPQLPVKYTDGIDFQNDFLIGIQLKLYIKMALIDFHKIMFSPKASDTISESPPLVTPICFKHY